MTRFTTHYMTHSKLVFGQEWIFVLKKNLFKII